MMTPTLASLIASLSQSMASPNPSLQKLIENAKAAHDGLPPVTDTYWFSRLNEDQLTLFRLYEAAVDAIGYYCIAHAADIAERERLERAVVEAWYSDPATRNGDSLDEAVERALDALFGYIIAHAETETTHDERD